MWVGFSQGKQWDRGLQEEEEHDICGTSDTQILEFRRYDWSAGCKKPKAGGEAGKIGGRQNFETISS